MKETNRTLMDEMDTEVKATLTMTTIKWHNDSQFSMELGTEPMSQKAIDLEITGVVTTEIPRQARLLVKGEESEWCRMIFKTSQTLLAEDERGREFSKIRGQSRTTPLAVLRRQKRRELLSTTS